MREERIFLTLDELTIVAGQSGVFALSNFVQGLVQVPYDMELIIEDGSLRSFLTCGLFKRLPHVHDRKSYFTSFFWPQLVKEAV